jgi:hypothetical protein
MVFQRFGMICLISMVFGIWFALLVQDTKADRAFRSVAPCPIAFHPACGRITE